MILDDGDHDDDDDLWPSSTWMNKRYTTTRWMLMIVEKQGTAKALNTLWTEKNK